MQGKSLFWTLVVLIASTPQVLAGNKCTLYSNAGLDREDCEWTECGLHGGEVTDATRPGGYKVYTSTKGTYQSVICSGGGGAQPNPGKECCNAYGGGCFLPSRYKNLWCFSQQ